MKRALLLVASAAIASAALAQVPKEADIDAGPVFVVAQKPLDGGPFHQAVAVVAPLPRGGHIGVVLNRPLNLTLAQVFPDDAPSKAVRGQLHFGGLYRLNAVVAIVRAAHPPAPTPKALGLAPGVWLVLDEEPIDRIIREQPNEARYYTGFVMWEEGLLREQISSGRLGVAKADPAQLFLKDTSGLYDEVSRRILDASHIKRVVY